MHTTQTYSKTILTENESQIILYDTPGVVTKKEMEKYNISKSFTSSCRYSIQNADIIAVIQDISNSYTRNMLHASVLSTLNDYKHLPSFLILNKIDMIRSKRIILDLIKVLTNDSLISNDRRYLPWKNNDEKFLNEMNRPVKYKNKESLGWPYFSDVFLVSSISGDGIGQVKHYLKSKCIQKQWEYSKNDFTDRTIEQLVVENVRATLMHFLPNEIPYKLKIELDYLDESNGKL